MIRRLSNSWINFLFSTALSMSSITEAAILSFAFREYPLVNNWKHIHDEVHEQTRPGVLARENLRAIQQINLTSGIYATYAGYVTPSDWFGRIILPLMQSKRTVYIIITTKMTPIIMLGNTIHHWELEEGTPASIFKIEEKKDEITKISFWQVTQEQLPQDNVIPLPSILIFARPTDIYLPTGIYPISSGPHMLLPDMYVKSSLNRTSNALYVLNINQFFGSLQTKGKANQKDLMLLTYP